MATTAVQSNHRKLYHYQSFNEEYIKHALQGRFYFSNPEHFNDPWDCDPWFGTHITDPSYRTRCIEFYSQFRDSNLSAEDCKNQLLADPHLLPKLIEKTTKAVRKTIADNWRIYCLTPHADSALMWSHYSNKHCGVCLEFDAKHPVIGGAYQVMYRRELPALDLPEVATKEVVQILLNKSDVWSYEDEYRIIGRDGQVDGITPQFLPITDKSYLELPSGTLSAIIVGCRGNFDAVKTLVAASAPGLAVKRMVRDDARYRVRIAE